MKESYVSLLEERRLALRETLLQILGQTAEFVCEIGCGHGHFLTAYATEYPDQICVGVDLSGERIDRACRKRDRARLSNLHFVRADARLFITMIPKGARISSLFLLFPDPWPKLRHRKHRIVQPDFLETVADRATPGCRLCFRTDHVPYFADTKEIFRNHPRWRLIDEPWPFEYESVFQQRAESFASIVAVVSAPHLG
jgi:tRNA (guanine-N7-)-methyltransferase